MQEYQTGHLRDWLFDQKGQIPFSGILLTDLCRYLELNITPWSRSLLEKLTVSQLVNKFPAF
jgi:hypothetical protein